MHYRCRWCDFEVEEGHITTELMAGIFKHERTHPEYFDQFKEKTDDS